MKRRHFGLLATASATAITAGMSMRSKPAFAAVSADQAALLQTTLTPTGAERAGNADGSIPAWTGGLTTIPAGWTPASGAFPDIYADEKPIVTINASNMAEHKDRLTEGLMYMMANQGFSINVYPTHRTDAQPQYVYDYTAKNALSTQPVAGGSRLGFTNAFGGFPFPIINQADPYEAGAQVVWNHIVHWVAYEYFAKNYASYSVLGGTVTLLSDYHFWSRWNWNKPNGSIATFDGVYGITYIVGDGPPSNQGSQEMVSEVTDPLKQPGQGWEYLGGQGRVRKLPEVQYDIPLGLDGGLINFDEANIFLGAMDDYDWKLIGKTEKYVVYNSSKTNFMTRADLGRHFVNPDVVRWELHRVWEVEMTLHPGKRNVVPHRKIYIDEDSWIGLLSDEWDPQGNLWKFSYIVLTNRPDMPGSWLNGGYFHNFQEDGYICSGIWNVDAAPSNRVIVIGPVPDSLFNPQSMAAQSQF